MDLPVPSVAAAQVTHEMSICSWSGHTVTPSLCSHRLVAFRHIDTISHQVSCKLSRYGNATSFESNVGELLTPAAEAAIENVLHVHDKPAVSDKTRQVKISLPL